MNDVQLLTEQLEREPNNSIVASMLLDELQTARNMTYSEAFRHVAQVMHYAEEGRQLTEACRLMLPQTASQGWLVRHVIAFLQPEFYADFSVLVITGEEPPVALHPAPPPDTEPGSPITVTVGARWVLEEWKLEQKRRADAKERRAKARRTK